MGLGLGRQLVHGVGMPLEVMVWGFGLLLLRDCGFLALASVLLQEQVYYLAVFLRWYEFYDYYMFLYSCAEWVVFSAFNVQGLHSWLALLCLMC